MRDSDEMFVLPAHLRAEVIRRRGDEDAYVPPREALEVYLQRQREGRLRADRFLTAALAGSRSDAALLAEIRRPGFDDPARATPLQAALSTALIFSAGEVRQGPDVGFVESWVLGRGHGYALRALAELYDVQATWTQSAMTYSNQGFVRGAVDELWVPDLWLLARRMRELLAGVPEAEYRELLEVAEEYRDGVAAQRALTSFLFPERVEWVDADLAELTLPSQSTFTQGLTCYLLVSAITEGRQVAALAERRWWLAWPRHLGPLETLLASVGADALPLLLVWLDSGYHYQDSRARLITLISQLGGDAAIRVLIDRMAAKGGQHAVLATGDRFPRRTLRVLAETDPASNGGRTEDSAAEVGDPDGGALWARQVSLALRLLANAHRKEAEALLLLPDLGPEARRRLEAALEPPRGLPEVAADLLPPYVGEDAPGTRPGRASLPLWAEPFALPQLAEISGAAALPAEAVRRVVWMLSISTPGTPHPGLQAVRDCCHPDSLRDFAWALFENWQLADYHNPYRWVLGGLRWFGDDDTVRRLEPLIRAWPGENAHPRAVMGLDVLGDIGSEAAMRAVYRISQRVKFKALKDRAGQKITEIAKGLGLTAEQLGDRLVPDLGLDPDGRLRLDFGPRRFAVAFDELLKPYVCDEGGKRLKTLPKPGVNDDAELAKAATARFAALKKEARTVTTDQIARLEQAMCLRRRWSPGEFHSAFVAHPLIQHLARRLVWGSYDESGSLLGTFRIAEDLSFADIEDKPFEDALTVIGVVHPVELGALIPRWSDVFADYEILQPFAQLGRETYTLTDAEREAVKLTRFPDVEIPAGKLVGLTRRDWRRGDPRDNGIEPYILRPLPDGRAIVVNIEPGIDVGRIAESAPQQLADVWIARDGVGDWHLRAADADPFGTLDPVTASEILRDLTEVTAP